MLLAAVHLALALAPPARPLRRAGAPSAALALPSINIRSSSINLLYDLDQPRDELKSRFSRGDEQETKKSFAPKAAREAESSQTATDAAPAASRNQQLLNEIRAMQPEPIAAQPERQAVDLNGVRPVNLVGGALAYGAFAIVAWQGTYAAANYFAENPFESSFYVVQRFSAIARVVVVSLGSLGACIAAVAAAGQLALSVQITIGIQKGELDPNAERIDPYGGRKKGELEKMLGFMMGDKDAGTE